MTEQRMIIARQPELKVLNHSLENMLRGHGQIQLVSGKAGAGKTTLVTEFCRQAQQQNRDLIYAIGTCDPQSGPGNPYTPFREVLEILTGSNPSPGLLSEVSKENGSRLQRALTFSLKALVEVGPDILALIMPFGNIVGEVGKFAIDRTGWLDKKSEESVKQKLNKAKTSESGITQDQIFEQIINMLTNLSQKFPLVMILDDLQWADEASIDLFFRLSRRLEQSQIMLLGAYRQDEVAYGRMDRRHPLEKVISELKRNFGDIIIDLDEITRIRGQEFIEALLDCEPNRLRLDFRQALFEHTGGHPLFTVELLRALQMRGELHKDSEGYWTEGSQLDWSRLPARIEGVIEEHIQVLSEEQREILRVASVEGMLFTAEIIAQIRSIEIRQLINILSGELQKKHQLITSHDVQRVSDQRISIYVFSHYLMRLYLYETVDIVERAFLHEAVAVALEGLYGENSDQIAVQLANHYECAENPSKARLYLMIAGQQAASRFAYDLAIDYFRRALRQADAEANTKNRRLTFSIFENQGDALKTVGMRQEASQAYQNALKLLAQSEILDVSRLLRKLGNTNLEGHYYEAAWKYFSLAQSILEEHPGEKSLEWQREWLQVRLTQMNWFYWSYQVDQISEFTGRIQGVIEEFGSPLQRIEYYQLVAKKAFLQAGFNGSPESRLAASKAFKAAQDMGELNSMASTQFSFGFQLLWSDEWDQARNELLSALDSSRKTGNLLLQTQCLTYLTVLERRQGDNLERVAELVNDSLKAAQAVQRGEYIGVAMANAAWLAWRMFDFEKVEQMGQSALDVWLAGKIPYPMKWLVIWPLVDVCLTLEDLDRAIDLSRQMIDTKQQRLKQELAALLSQAIQGWEGVEQEIAQTRVRQALALAQTLHYL